MGITVRVILSYYKKNMLHVGIQKCQKKIQMKKSQLTSYIQKRYNFQSRCDTNMVFKETSVT